MTSGFSTAEVRKMITKPTKQSIFTTLYLI